MTPGDGPLEPTLEFPPSVRPEASPARSTSRLPAVHLPGELSLSTLALASGIAIAFEGFRLAARAGRKRSAAKKRRDVTTQLTVSYEWTQIVYERNERS